MKTRLQAKNERTEWEKEERKARIERMKWRDETYDILMKPGLLVSPSDCARIMEIERDAFSHQK